MSFGGWLFACFFSAEEQASGRFNRFTVSPTGFPSAPGCRSRLGCVLIAVIHKLNSAALDYIPHFARRERGKFCSTAFLQSRRRAS